MSSRYADLPDLCLHCEREPPANRFGLCARCHAVGGIRLLYLRRRGWSPAWERHLRRLAERAGNRQDLFPPGIYLGKPRTRAQVLRDYGYD
jgi:hypothetical protein